MAITQPDLKFYHAIEVSDAVTNGGRMDQTHEAITGVKNNIWPNVSSSQRVSGISHYRKIFCTPESNSNDPFVDPRAWNHKPTPGGDYIYMFAGTKVDTKATINEARKYGSATLKSNAAIGATTIVVTVENATLTGIFAASDKIRISNQILPTGAGDYQQISLTVAAPLVSGLDVTLYLSEPLTAAYSAGSSVSSLYFPGTTSTGIGTIVVTSASGVTNALSKVPVLNNAGTRDENITITMSTSTLFTVVGSVSGALASGDVGLDYTAYNPTNGRVLINLPAGFFTGTWAPLDKVVIPTIANNFAIWLKRVVPAGTNTLAGDENITAFLGESA